jgi:hypothetical protein
VSTARINDVDDIALGPIHVALDCLEVVRGLVEGNMGYFGGVVREIRERTWVRGNTIFIHERKESNGQAHRLVRSASSLPLGRYMRSLESPQGLNIDVIIDFAE